MPTTLLNYEPILKCQSLTLDIKVRRPRQPSARAATPAAVIISHQEKFIEVICSIIMSDILDSIGSYHLAASSKSPQRIISHVIAGGDVQLFDFWAMTSKGLTCVVS